jgi:hypothetical protein
MRIACDLDGVLGDFKRHVLDVTGFDIRRHSIDLIWPKVATVADFWLTMPVKYRAHDLWEVIQPYDPVILTGCPQSMYDVAAAQKTIWAKQHFGQDVGVITCLTRNKTQHLLHPQDILIDDFNSTVRRWRKAGGRAVHFRDPDQAISDLRILLNDTKGPD